MQGIDGTDGNQPRFISVIGNVAREIGHFEKQSSFYVQGKSCQNTIHGNGPTLLCDATRRTCSPGFSSARPPGTGGGGGALLPGSGARCASK